MLSPLGCSSPACSSHAGRKCEFRTAEVLSSTTLAPTLLFPHVKGWQKEIGALRLMKSPARRTNANLIAGGPGYREGRRQRAIRRLLIGAGGKPVTTSELMAAVYARGEPWVHWRWQKARESAERYAERVTPKTRH